MIKQFLEEAASFCIQFLPGAGRSDEHASVSQNCSQSEHEKAFQECVDLGLISGPATDEHISIVWEEYFRKYYRVRYGIMDNSLRRTSNEFLSVLYREHILVRKYEKRIAYIDTFRVVDAPLRYCSDDGKCISLVFASEVEARRWGRASGRNQIAVRHAAIKPEKAEDSMSACG